MSEISLSSNLKTITAEINSYKQIAGQSIFEIGRRLKHIKENDLVHGEWERYCNNTIEITPAYANRYIKVFEQFKSSNQYTGIGLNKLYHIATLPEEEREKEHVTSKGETKTVNEMTVRELEEVKRKNREQEQRIKELENQEPEVIEKEVPKEIVPHDYDGLKSDNEQLEFSNKQYREIIDELEQSGKSYEVQNKRLEEELEKLRSYLGKKEITEEEQERLEETINQLDKKKKAVNHILDSNDKLIELEQKFHKFFDESMAPLKYKPLVNDLQQFNGTERVKELINLARAWVEDMDYMIPSNERKTIEGEVVND